MDEWVFYVMIALWIILAESVVIALISKYKPKQPTTASKTYVPKSVFIAIGSFYYQLFSTGIEIRIDGVAVNDCKGFTLQCDVGSLPMLTMHRYLMPKLKRGRV